MADRGYIKAGKEVPNEDWLLNAGAEIAELIEIRLREPVERHAPVTRDDSVTPSVTDCVTNALLGAFWRLWAYADAQIRSDNTLDLTRKGLAQVMRVPVAWLDYIPEKWLRFLDDRRVELPNYCQKNGIVGKDIRKEINEIKREQSRVRSSRYRSRKKSRTSSRTRHAPVTRDVTQLSREKSVTTGTGTVTGIPKPVTESGSASSALPGSLASANGASRAGVNSADPTPLHERQRRARAFAQQFPGFERGRIAAMFRLTAEQLDEALAEHTPTTTEGDANGNSS